MTDIINPDPEQPPKRKLEEMFSSLEEIRHHEWERHLQGGLIRKQKRVVVVPKKVAPRLFFLDDNYYAFITGIEGRLGEPLLVKTECVKYSWIESLWNRAKLSEAGKRFLALVNGKEWEKDLPGLLRANATFFYQSFQWFLQQVYNAPTALFDFYVPPESSLQQSLKDNTWYMLTLDRSQDVMPFTDPALYHDDRYICKGTLSTLGNTASEDRPPETRWVSEIIIVPTTTEDGSLPQVGLKMLHFIQTDPTNTINENQLVDAQADAVMDQAVNARPKGSRPVQMSMPALRDGLAGFWRGVYQRVSGLCKQAQAALPQLATQLAVSMTPAPHLALAHATAGAAYPRQQAQPRHPQHPSVSPYIGYPQGGITAAVRNTVGTPQAPNPMVQGAGTQPFVAIVNVGAGNCTALYDNRGKAIVYFDLGRPLPTHQNTQPVAVPKPCFCDSPLVILSHWDFDHYSMARDYVEARQLRWITPQQQTGTQSTKLLSQIIAAGGQVYVWTAGAPSHLRFPWGFVEHSTRVGGNENTSGLNLYVCVRDVGGNADTAWNVAGGVFLVGPGQRLVGMGRISTDAAPVEPGRAVAAVTQVRTLPNNSRKKEATAAAIALHPQVNQNPVPSAQNVARVAGTAVEMAAQGGATIQEVAVAAAAAPVLIQAGKTTAQVVQAVRLVAAAVPNPINNKANDITTAGNAAGAGVPEANLRQHLGGIAVEVLRYAAGNSAAQLAAAAATINIGVSAAVIEAAILAARAAQGAAANNETIAAAEALGLKPGAVGLPLAAAVPDVLQNAAPFHANERYMLLTGDCDFSVVASQTANPTPTVVGLVAMHHGSNLVDDLVLNEYHIPWAPGTAAAKAGAAADAAITGNAPALASAVSTTVALANPTIARDQIVNTARAAVEALRQGGNQDDAAIAAAAAVLAIAQGATAAQVGLAAVRALAATGPRPFADKNATINQVRTNAQVLLALNNNANAAAIVAAIACEITLGATPANLANAAHTANNGVNVVLTEATIKAAMAGQRVATAGALQNALAAGPNIDPVPVPWNAAHNANAQAGLAAAVTASKLLTPTTRDNPGLTATTVAVAIEPNVRAQNPDNEDLVAACAAALAAARGGGNAQVQAVAAAIAPHLFPLADGLTAATLDAEDATDNYPILRKARSRRLALTQAVAAATAAIAAVPNGIAKANQITTVGTTANVRNALRDICNTHIHAPELRVAIEATLAGHTNAQKVVAIAAAPEAIAEGATITEVLNATVAALAAVPGGGVTRTNAITTVATAGGVTGTGIPPNAARWLAAIAVDVARGAGATIPALSNDAVAVQRGVKVKDWRKARITTAIAHSNTLVQCINTLAAIAVEVVGYAAGPAASQLAAAAHTGAGGGLAAVVIEKAIQCSAAVAAAAGHLARVAATAMGVEVGIVKAAVWGGPIEHLAHTILPLVEAAAADALDQPVDPIIEALMSAQIQKGHLAVTASNLQAGENASARVAYSYGVKHQGRNQPYEHCYESGIFGTGHPDPIAVYKYDAHGWTERRNTAAQAHQSTQPDGVSPRGHIALGWEVAVGPVYRPLSVIPVPNCAWCGNVANNPSPVTVFVI